MAHVNCPLWRLPLVGEGHILGAGIFKRNYREFSPGVDNRAATIVFLHLLVKGSNNQIYLGNCFVRADGV